MNIQSFFYLLASIYLILGIVIMIAMLVFVWRLKTSADAFQKKVRDHVNEMLSVRKFAGIIPLVGMVMKWVKQRREKKES